MDLGDETRDQSILSVRTTSSAERISFLTSPVGRTGYWQTRSEDLAVLHPVITFYVRDLLSVLESRSRTGSRLRTGINRGVAR